MVQSNKHTSIQYVLCCVVSCRVVLCCVVLCRRVVLCFVVSCLVVFCCIVSCRVVSCCVVSCCVVSCCVVSCCVVLCRVVMYFISPTHFGRFCDRHREYKQYSDTCTKSIIRTTQNYRHYLTRFFHHVAHVSLRLSKNMKINI